MGHVFSDIRKLAVVQAHASKAAVEQQPKEDSDDHSHQPDQAALQEEESGDLSRLEAHGSQQADLARALIDGHQQQVEDADAGDELLTLRFHDGVLRTDGACSSDNRPAPTSYPGRAGDNAPPGFLPIFLCSGRPPIDPAGHTGPRLARRERLAPVAGRS
jgi:hypothetical protein